MTNIYGVPWWAPVSRDWGKNYARSQHPTLPCTTSHVFGLICLWGPGPLSCPDCGSETSLGEHWPPLHTHSPQQLWLHFQPVCLSLPAWGSLLPRDTWNLLVTQNAQPEEQRNSCQWSKRSQRESVTWDKLSFSELYTMQGRLHMSKIAVKFWFLYSRIYHYE